MRRALLVALALCAGVTGSAGGSPAEGGGGRCPPPLAGTARNASDCRFPIYATRNGGLSFEGGTVSVECFAPGWGAVRVRDGEFLPDGLGATWNVLGVSGDSPLFSGRASWEPQPDGSVRGIATLDCLAPCKMQCVALSASTATLPSGGAGDGTASSCEFALGCGRSMRIAFDSPVQFHCQDESQWSGAWKTRFGQSLYPRSFEPGDRVEWRFSLSSSCGLSLAEATPFEIREGAGWSRLDYKKDAIPGSALDFSALGLADAPAGKHGWLRAVGDHFEFEGRPGVAVRFHGVNLCFSANYPDHETADALVERLVRSGYNSVRIHHHDGAWAAAHDRLDYLAARCIESGLYLTTDLYVSRPVPWRDIGVGRDGAVPPDRYKRLVESGDPGAFADWCAFSRSFLEHVNPYTGRAWKDEPGAPLLSLVNEGKPDAETAAAAFERCAAFVRSLGCRALLTDDNNGANHAPGEGATPLYDYIDNHIYADHPHFSDRHWSLPSHFEGSNPAVSGKPAALLRGWADSPGAKPYTASEWSYCGPSRYRSCGGILFGALAAHGGWDGLWRFAYAHDAARFSDACPLGPGYFDVAIDPAAAAADRAVAALFLRGQGADAECGAAPSIDAGRGSFAVATPLFCGGFADGGAVEAGPLSFEIVGGAGENPPSVVPTALWAASLDAEALPRSSRILLCMVSDVQGDGTRFSDATRKEITAWGRGFLAKNATVAVTLRTDDSANPGAFTVYRLDTAGRRIARETATLRGGALEVTLATQSPDGSATIYWEIVREAK